MNIPHTPDAGITLVEILVYVALLAGFFVTIPVAGSRSVQWMEDTRSHLTLLIDVTILDQKLARVLSCGEIVQVLPTAVRMRCMDQEADVVLRADGALVVERLDGSVVHMLTPAGAVTTFSDTPLFSLAQDMPAAVEVHALYAGREVRNTYYAYLYAP